MDIAQLELFVSSYTKMITSRLQVHVRASGDQMYDRSIRSNRLSCGLYYFLRYCS
ncbi:hypothetical protein RchiOBHm_Chr2g0131281 [Rosa chinensis]|uniref:Uncharacterized protein n=1 Tax=Rosa chinensis TaxID=74649 RepID=A0A2P6RV07_ROSCH|nr:hypothetical protein RchiOBHm_Chr2g0131281 [Rosa chinensis]